LQLVIRHRLERALRLLAAQLEVARGASARERVRAVVQADQRLR
jgi:hypothetical protein